MTDHTVTSDFHFLEDVLRNVDAGKRVLKQTRASGSGSDFHNNHNKRQRRTSLEQEDDEENSTPCHPLLNASRTQNLPVVPAVPVHHNTNWSHLSPRWRHVAKHALEQRAIKILFMPNGMQRRQLNQTHVKKDVLHWTVEWIFHHPTTTTAKEGETSAATTQTVRVTLNESTELQKALMEHPQLQRQITTANNIDTLGAAGNVKLLIKQIPLKTYAVISLSSTLRDVLKERTVIEYPTIEVVPMECLEEFTIALQEVKGEEETKDTDDKSSDERQPVEASSEIPKVESNECD